MTAATAALTGAIIICVASFARHYDTDFRRYDRSGGTTAPDVQSIRQSDEIYFPRPEPALSPSQEYTLAAAGARSSKNTAVEIITPKLAVLQ